RLGALLYAEAARVYEAAVGEDADLAGLIDSTGQGVLEDSRAREALIPLKRALALRERLLPPDHPDIAVSLNNVALALFGDGQREEARTLFRKAVDMRRRLRPSGSLQSTVLDAWACKEAEIENDTVAKALFEEAERAMPRAELSPEIRARRLRTL